MTFNLSYKEKENFKKLSNIFDENYRVFHLFSKYLNEMPDFVSLDLISEITNEVDVSKEYAFGVILASLFGIKSETSKEDRLFERNRIIPAIKELDIEKFTNNPYYLNIKIPDVINKNWTLKNEVYSAFRGFICDDLSFSPDYIETPKIGFFSKDFAFPAVLENGNEWMTLTPADLVTCENEINEAKGKVITFGLGLGYYAYMVSNKDDVSSVTIIEKSKDVISLFKEHILPQFPNKDKIKIVEADAFLYAENTMPSENYDYAFVDTWRDASDGLPMYSRMKPLESLNKNTKFTYWIEGLILSRMRSIVFENIRNETYNLIPLNCEITTT